MVLIDDKVWFEFIFCVLLIGSLLYYV
jgi:hypothetical protein